MVNDEMLFDQPTVDKQVEFKFLQDTRGQSELSM